MFCFKFQAKVQLNPWSSPAWTRLWYVKCLETLCMAYLDSPQQTILLPSCDSETCGHTVELVHFKSSSRPHQQLLFWGAQCNERHQRPTFCMPGPVMLHRDGQQELSTRALVTTIAYYSIGPLNLATACRAASLDLSGSSVE